MRSASLPFMLLLAALALWPLHAQAQDLAFEQIRLPGGSAQNFVTGMAQDRQGFLWLATHAGLLRNDGYRSIIYRHNPLDSTSLAGDRVENVYVDRAGTLWAGTFGSGLDRFDPLTETFTHFRRDPASPASLSGNTVTVMLEDRAGAFWVGTHQGLNHMDRSTGTFTQFRHDPNDPKSLSDDQVRILYEDREGTLWVGTGDAYGQPGPGGLNRFDRETETFTHFVHDPGDETSLTDSHVQALFEDSRGTFWVGTFGDGLHSMDRERGTPGSGLSPRRRGSGQAFTRYLNDPGDPSRLSGPHQPDVIRAAGITFVHEDRSGALWIGALNAGLNRYDPATGQLTRYQYTPDDPNSLGNDQVWRMYESREGVLWVLTWGGLFKVNQKRSLFRHYRLDASGGSGSNGVTAFHEDGEGALWVGTESGGLSRFDWSGAEPLTGGQTGRVKRYLHDPEDPQSLSDNAVSFLYGDRQGVLWVGTGSGLDRMDRQTGRFTRYTPDAQSPGAGGVSFIHEDRQGVLWVGTAGGGLNRFDRQTGRFTRYLHDPANPKSLSENLVTFVYEDREGTLWVGTGYGGLNRFDPAQGSFTQYPYNVADSSGLSGATVTGIYEDDEGALWISTWAGGLNRFDRQTGRFTHFTTANSDLPDDVIGGILEDEQGNLWMGSGSDITRFDPGKRTFRTYELDLSFSASWFPTSYKSRGGAIFFGGQGGFVVFSLEAVLENSHQNPHPPQVVLTGLSLSNQPVRPSPEGPLKDLLWETSTLALAHDQNTFALAFVGLHFEDPARNRYTYRLEGYDEAWREAGTDRQASYYKVPPGRYVFRAKASSAEGVWNEEGASLEVVVLPPWWRTLWAYVLYGLLFAAGVFAVDRVQRRRLIRKEREKAMLREKELRTEAAEAWSNYLQSENLRQTQELDAARHLQLSMLPERVPEHPVVEIAAFMKTATEVGGDYYDFDLSDDGTLTFAIGDATGHGLQAGTMVTAMKSLFLHCAREPDIVRVLEQSTKTLRRMHLPRLYMALALGKLNGHTLELAGAGMPPALLWRAASDCIEEVPLKGMPLGGPGAFGYRKQCVALCPGDTLVLMSDGLPELRGASGEMLGYERMAALLAEAAGRRPEEVIAHLVGAARAWGDGQVPDDDMTFLVMKVKA